MSPLIPATSRGQLQLISRQVLTGNAASIDAQNLDQSGAHLLIIAGVRTDVAAVLGNCLLTFNNDGGANYYRQFLRGAVAAASAAQNLATTSFSLDGAGASAAAGEVGLVQLWVPSYTSANVKVTTGSTIVFGDTAGASARLTEVINKWNSTAAINRVTLTFGSGTTLTAPSFLDIYALA